MRTQLEENFNFGKNEVGKMWEKQNPKNIAKVKPTNTTKMELQKQSKNQGDKPSINTFGCDS